MKLVRSSTHDRLSELPSNITDVILMFLPLRDAMRTSILSSKWRFQWATVPQLVFDNNLTFKLPKRPRDIVRQIYEILLLHQGPILKFTLDMNRLRSCSEIDKIIIFLSRNGIQELTLSLWDDDDDDEDCCGPRLPSYLFSCQELRHLCLNYVGFKPPPTFTGFSKLISLVLHHVDLDPYLSISYFPLLERLKLEVTTTLDYLSINAPNLKFFCFKGGITQIGLINTPVLAVLSLDGNNNSNFDLIKLFGSLPLIENLRMFYTFVRMLAVAGKAPNKLPTGLNYLRILDLSSISLDEMDHLSSVLCLMWSSPNLERLKLTVALEGESTDEEMETVLEYLKMQYTSARSLNKLREVEIIIELKYAPFGRSELEFIKLVLAISPELEIIHINPVDIETEYRMLLELLRYRRASPKAEIVCSKKSR